MDIAIGDDGKYIMTRIHTFNFQRESGFLVKLKDVMFILGLNKNLIFVAVFLLETFENY